MYPPSDDLNLINKCVNGDKESWDLFVNRFSKLVYHSIIKTFQSYSSHYEQEDLEDLFNNLFLSLVVNDYRKLKQFEGKQGCTLSSWIRLICIRQTIDFLRAQKQELSIDDDSPLPIIDRLSDNRTSVDNQIENSETERIISEAIAALPDSDRLFMELYYEKDLPPEEIAEIMQVSVNTVYSKKNRVREKLKNILEDKGNIARN